MKFCEGKIVELDPNKQYWLIIKQSSPLARNLGNIRKIDGAIHLVDELDDIEFVENPDRIKGVIVKEF